MRFSSVRQWIISEMKQAIMDNNPGDIVDITTNPSASGSVVIYLKKAHTRLNQGIQWRTNVFLLWWQILDMSVDDDNTLSSFADNGLCNITPLFFSFFKIGACLISIYFLESTDIEQSILLLILPSSHSSSIYSFDWFSRWICRPLWKAAQT